MLWIIQVSNEVIEWTVSSLLLAKLKHSRLYFVVKDNYATDY